MRVINIIDAAMKHNELLVKWIKGEMWFKDNKVSQEKKDEQEPRFRELLKQISDNVQKLEDAGVTFLETDDRCEILEVIEIPAALKREKIEIWLEQYKKFRQDKQPEPEQLKLEAV